MVRLFGLINGGVFLESESIHIRAWFVLVGCLGAIILKRIMV